MANVQRERVGLTRDELLKVYNGGGLDTVQDPIDPLGLDVDPPPPPADDTPNNTTPVVNQPDNSLLIFGALGLFAAIAFTGRRSVSGPSIPSAKWFLPAALVGGAVLWFKFKKPSQAEQLNAIMVWVDQQADTAANKDYFVSRVRSMTPEEVTTVWDYLTHYVSKGIPLPDNSPLRPKISAIRDKYQIFT